MTEQLCMVRTGGGVRIDSFQSFV